jgi:D-glycerate 3-kinase
MKEGSAAEAIYRFILTRAQAGRTLTVGLCGAQGSGKSTAAEEVAARLRAVGWVVAVVSLDDLYLPKEARSILAREVHPLLQVRGVPGTHDPELGVRLLGDLGRTGVTRLPRFDKAADTRAANADWPVIQGPADIILFEGWCVGAMPQADGDLAEPVNGLEREHDPDGRWRRHVNDWLAGPYARLFGMLDCLILLAAPSFEVVVGWRQEQEHALRARLADEGADFGHTMDDVQVEHFVRHYERLTRHILTEMPARADLVLRLDANRTMVESQLRA